MSEIDARSKPRRYARSRAASARRGMKPPAKRVDRLSIHPGRTNRPGPPIPGHAGRMRATLIEGCFVYAHPHGRSVHMVNVVLTHSALGLDSNLESWACLLYTSPSPRDGLLS